MPSLISDRKTNWGCPCRFAAAAKSPSAEHACRPRARPTCRSAQWAGCRWRSFWRAVRRPSGCGRRHPQHRLPSAVPHAVRPALAASRACSCCCAPTGTYTSGALPQPTRDGTQTGSSQSRAGRLTLQRRGQDLRPFTGAAWGNTTTGESEKSTPIAPAVPVGDARQKEAAEC